jgi:hypothetical protein
MASTIGDVQMPRRTLGRYAILELWQDRSDGGDTPKNLAGLFKMGQFDREARSAGPERMAHTYLARMPRSASRYRFINLYSS